MKYTLQTHRWVDQQYYLMLSKWICLWYLKNKPEENSWWWKVRNKPDGIRKLFDPFTFTHCLYSQKFITYIYRLAQNKIPTRQYGIPV